MQKSKNNLAILIANALTYYNTFIFIFLGDYLVKNFILYEHNKHYEYYDHYEPLIYSMFIIFTIHVITIPFRPFGIYFFGKLAANIGPSKALRYALISMSLPSFCIAILPGYCYIGHFAGIGILILRCLQSFFISGAFYIARVYLLSDNPERRSFCSSMYLVSILLGILLSLVAYEFVSNSTNPCLYSRYALIFGCATSILGMFIRSTNDAVKNITIDEADMTWKTSKNNSFITLKIAVISVFSYFTYPMILLIAGYALYRMKDLKIEYFANIPNVISSICILIILISLVLIISGYLMKKVNIKKSMIITVALLILMLTYPFVVVLEVLSGKLILTYPFVVVLEALSSKMNFEDFVMSVSKMNFEDFVMSVTSGIAILITMVLIPFTVALNIWLANSTDHLGNEKYPIIGEGEILGIYILGLSALLLALVGSMFLEYGYLVWLYLSCAFIIITGLASIYFICVGLSPKSLKNS